MLVGLQVNFRNMCYNNDSRQRNNILSLWILDIVRYKRLGYELADAQCNKSPANKS